jgi:hypothetical protein
MRISFFEGAVIKANSSLAGGSPKPRGSLLCMMGGSRVAKQLWGRADEPILGTRYEKRKYL